MRTSVLFLCLIALLTFNDARLAQAEDPWFSHHLTFDKNGVATVKAQLTLPAPPSTTYAVLSDYPRWPDLFPSKPTLKHIDKTEDRTRISMQMPAHYLPVTLELVTDTVEIPPAQLITTLVNGDFKRYDWTWDLSKSPSDTTTIAMLTLIVQPSIWAPNWVLQWFLESELKTHFHLLRKQVLARHQAAPSISAAPGSQ